MKNLVTLACAAALALSTAGAHAAGNLVVNGSFENGPTVFGSFAGWTTSLVDGNTFVDSAGKTGTAYGQSTDGLWSAFFGSTAANGGAAISQALATTANQAYTLSFDLADDNGGLDAANAFAVFVDGSQVFGVTGLASQGYVHHTASFTAAGAGSVLSVRAFNDNGWVELDNVSVAAAVPEPSSLALMAAGLAGLALRRRRRD